MTSITSHFTDSLRSRSAAAAWFSRDASDPLQNPPRFESRAAAATKATTAPANTAEPRHADGAVSLQGMLFTMKDLAKAPPINVAELPEEAYQAFIAGDRQQIEALRFELESRYTDPSWTESLPVSPLTLPYATVVSGGRVIATIDNQGVVTTEERSQDGLRGRCPDGSEGKSGPDLAKIVAADAARLLGGTVTPAPTALSQDAYLSLSRAGPPVPVIDVAAMEADPDYRRMQRLSENLDRLVRDRALFLDQQKSGAN